jgi:hypothetical protein
MEATTQELPQNEDVMVFDHDTILRIFGLLSIASRHTNAAYRFSLMNT